MAGIVEAQHPTDGMPTYTVSDAELGPGASLGNGHAWINTGTDGRIHTLFSVDVGEEVAGPLMVRYCSAGARVTAHASVQGPQKMDVPLAPTGPGRFVIHPVYQQHAFAAARYHPEFMVRALCAAYEHYNRHPRVYNTVPGQFSEWFDGESLINRGMRLSPWEPPRFLWAAVEGVCGIMVGPGQPGIRPLIPPDWKWCAAVNVLYHGDHITAFAGRRESALHVYANVEFTAAGPSEVLTRDVTELVRTGHAGLHAVALEDDDRVVVAIGSCCDQAMTTALDLTALLPAEPRLGLREYSSEQDRWGPEQVGRGAGFGRMGVRVEAGGYHILDFTRRS